MAMPIVFKKRYAEYLISCIQNGEPFGPPSERWDLNGCLAVAGACLFMAFSHPPMKKKRHGEIDPDNAPKDCMDAEGDQHVKELLSTIGIYSVLTQKVFDDLYDDHFESQVEGVIEADPDGRKITFLTGHKDLKGLE